MRLGLLFSSIAVTLTPFQVNSMGRADALRWSGRQLILRHFNTLNSSSLDVGPAD